MTLAPADLAADGTTVVDDDAITPRRVRRPLDLVRLVGVLVSAAALVAACYFLTATSTGISQDLVGATGHIPALVQSVLNVVAGLGVLALPLAAAVDLLLRHRSRQLLEAIVAMSIAVGVALLATYLVTTFGSDRLVMAITGGTGPGRVILNPVITGLVAFVTVARLMGRDRWAWFAAVTVAAVPVVALTTGSTTVAVSLLSLLTGWAIGLVARYALGTATTRPSGVEVAAALREVGLPVVLLRATHSIARGREYDAVTRDHLRLRVLVLDRDRDGAGLSSAAWRQLRLRTGPSDPNVFSMRAQLEHAALMSYASTIAGARVPALRAAVGIDGPDSTLLAYDHVEGISFAHREPGSITDDDLESAYRAVRRLHDQRIVHRSLSPEHFIRGEDGTLWLTGLQHGSIAASDVQERIDLAELLCTGTLLTDARRAVATGTRVFGVERVVRALPALQTIALSPDTRRRIRAHKGVLAALREEIVAQRPAAAEAEAIELRRVKPRTVVTIVAGSAAAYVLLSQLASVDLLGLARSADWRWASLALALTVVTFIGAALSLSGFVPEKLTHVKTFAAQLAAGFATLVSPPTVGAVAVNVRYLQKSGLPPALAAASVGVSQVFAFLVHICLLVGTAVLAGQSAAIDLTPPKAAMIGVGTVVALVGLLLLLGPVRRILSARVRPILAEVGPRLVTIGQRPWKIVEGVGGILLLNSAFALCMVACCEAFGAGNANYAAIALVYLAGSTIGQAAPTPGGLGAVEAAYIAGLTLAGVSSEIAVSATLLFRLLTFWLPTIPGYWCFTWLQRVGSL